MIIGLRGAEQILSNPSAPVDVAHIGLPVTDAMLDAVMPLPVLIGGRPELLRKAQDAEAKLRRLLPFAHAKTFPLTATTSPISK